MFLRDRQDVLVLAKGRAGRAEGGVGLDEDVVRLAEGDEGGLREVGVEFDLAAKRKKGASQQERKRERLEEGRERRE